MFLEQLELSELTPENENFRKSILWGCFDSITMEKNGIESDNFFLWNSSKLLKNQTLILCFIKLINKTNFCVVR